MEGTPAAKVCLFLIIFIGIKLPEEKRSAGANGDESMSSSLHDGCESDGGSQNISNQNHQYLHSVTSIKEEIYKIRNDYYLSS